MTIQTQIEFKEYLRLLYKLTYKKPLNILSICLGSFLLLMTFLSLLSAWLSNGELIFKEVSVTLIMGILILGSTPLAVYTQAKRNYFTDARIRELITYTIQHDAFTLSGESFNTTLSWNKVWKVVETKDWVVLYQNQLVANLIPKRALQEGQLETLRSIINAHPTIKKKLLT